MHRKSLTLTLIVLLALLSALPAFAQESGWFIYLHNGQTKDLLRVYQDGRQETYSLGLPENVYIGSYDMTFSADGSRVTYCAVTYPQPDTPGAPSARLVTRDIAAQANLLEVDMGAAEACHTGQNALSADGSLLAVGLLNFTPGNPNADTSGPLWTLLVLDSSTGDVLYELNEQSPAAAGLATPERWTFLPWVQKIEANEVIFALVPWGTEGFPADAYRWDVAADSVAVVEGEQWSQPRVETLRDSGEQVWLAYNPDLPATQPIGPMPAYNVVRYLGSGGANTILHIPDYTLGDVRFINNGQQLALMLMPPFDPNQPDAQPIYRYVALDRSGNMTDLFTDPGYNAIANAPDGFVRLQFVMPTAESPNQQYRLYHVASGQTTELWASDAAEPFASWELAWAAPVPTAAGLQPFAVVRPQ